MRRLISLALRLRVAVVVVMAAFAVIAALVVSKAPFDVFPEFAPPLVEIQTEAPGLSTEEVERLITVPLEYGLNGTAFVQTIRSKSVLGLSSVVLIFQPGTDVLRARQLVQERLARVALTLPAVAHPPVLLSPLSSTSRVAMVQLSPAGLSPIEISVLARWVIVPRLLGVPGVANVAIWGFRDRQLQVLVDPDRLADPERFMMRAGPACGPRRAPLRPRPPWPAAPRAAGCRPSAGTAACTFGTWARRPVSGSPAAAHPRGPSLR